MNVMASTCPAHQGRDDRKSAKIAEANLTPQEGARVIGSFATSRDILRSPKVRQAGPPTDSPSEQTEVSNPGDVSFFSWTGTSTASAAPLSPGCLRQRPLSRAIRR
ncbi:hypothetical protein KRR38_28900 [Novosphingobium sp. G106]|uniref:hypothetical protein n=1 Tax=Novosphingobium sp. G106 TaxID=2849500 RepID=UPI001C2D4E8D|nr:hypothetical protein [Novosphingobium sp. G106]MBV1691585.1 hypothetical protein [Novosphingobium sp. G106]